MSTFPRSSERRSYLARIRALFAAGSGEAGAGANGEAVLALAGLPRPEDLPHRSGAPPAAYLERFTPSPLTSEDLLVGREEPLTDLLETFERWQAGRGDTVAVVGPAGSGKTSLLNCFTQRLPGGSRVLRASLDRRLTTERDVVDAVAAWFEADAAGAGPGAELGVGPETTPVRLGERLCDLEPRIVIVEGGHNLLLRVVGGRRVAETFLHVMSATRGRHFWMFMARRLPWQALDRHVRAGDLFTRVLAVDGLSEGELREAVLRRHAAGRLALTFKDGRELPESHAEERAPGEGAEREAGPLEQSVFRAIHAASGGNPLAALYFWTIGLRYEAAGETLTARPIGRLDHGFIRKLDRLSQLTLAEVAAHGELSTAEHSAIFRIDPLRSRLVFDLLTRSRLTDATPTAEGDVRCSLSPFSYEPIVEALRQLHLVD